MRFHQSTATATTLLAACIAILWLQAGCAAQPGEGLAIYLTAGDIRPADMPDTPYEVEITDQPVICSTDIIDYDADTHTMTLTPDAYARLIELDVPVTGRAFVVCVNGDPIYSGAFWVPYSSFLYEGVSLRKPLGAYGSTRVVLESGCPTPEELEGTDVRDDPRIIESLRQAGKLRRTQ